MINGLLCNSSNVSPAGRKVDNLLIVQHSSDIQPVQSCGVTAVVAISNSKSQKRELITLEQVKLINELVSTWGSIFFASEDTDEGERAAIEVFRLSGSARRVRWLKIRPGQTIIDQIGELPKIMF